MYLAGFFAMSPVWGGLASTFEYSINGDTRKTESAPPLVVRDVSTTWPSGAFYLPITGWADRLGACANAP
jgi:hypothetical protein